MKFGCPLCLEMCPIIQYNTTVKRESCDLKTKMSSVEYKTQMFNLMQQFTKTTSINDNFFCYL